MSNITRVGVDLAKNLIQVHAVDAAGKVGDQPHAQAREVPRRHRTVEAHRAQIMRKFDVTSTSELVARLVSGY